MNELQFVFFPFFVAIFGRNNPDNDKIEQTLQIDDLNISRLRYFPSFSSRPSPPPPHFISLFSFEGRARRKYASACAPEKVV